MGVLDKIYLTILGLGAAVYLVSVMRRTNDALQSNLMKKNPKMFPSFNWFFTNKKKQLIVVLIISMLLIWLILVWANLVQRVFTIDG